MPDYYSTKQAALITGASPQSIRAYSNTYRRYFSTEGAPEPGQQRKLTREDLRLVRYISQNTAAGLSHDQVAERLAAGELERFDWQPAESPAGGARESQGASEASLVPIAALQASQALLQDAQRRETEAIEQAQALQAEIQRLSLELGRAEGELAAIKAQKRRPKWLQWLAGGE